MYVQFWDAVLGQVQMTYSLWALLRFCDSRFRGGRFCGGPGKPERTWSGVAAQAVMRKPASHRLWMPSLAYWKSSSTHCSSTTGWVDSYQSHTGAQVLLCSPAAVQRVFETQWSRERGTSTTGQASTGMAASADLVDVAGVARHDDCPPRV